MISGTVTSARDAVITLTVRGPQGNSCDLETTIDTGFDGSLSCPPTLVEALGLAWRRRGRALLADGSEALFDIYEAELLWDGEWRRVVVDETHAAPLVGTSLLNGSELNIQFRVGGGVTIKRLPPQESA